MAWMQHGGFIIPLPPPFEGMTPSTQNDCVPVTVGVGVGVPVRVRVSTSVSQSNIIGQPNQQISQPVLQISAQPVQVWVPSPVGISNPMQQRLQANEVQIGEIVPTGSTLNQFAINFGAVGVTTLAVAAESGKLQAAQTIGQIARELAVNNAATADVIADAANITQNLVTKIRASGTSAEALRQAFVKAGLSFTESNNLVNAFYQGDKVLSQYVDDLLRVSPQIVQQAQNTLYQGIQRVVSQACAI